MLNAMKSVEGVEAFHVRAPNLDPPKADFYFYVDDGRDDIKWIPPHPNAYWAIDTHLGYGYRLWKAQQFDRVFVAQKEAVYQFERDGVRNVSWLPLACHPEAHPSREELVAKGATEQELARQWDIVFVGFLNDSSGPGVNNRVDYLDALFAAFPNSWLSANVFFEAMALRYAKARLGFNVSIKRDLNMRFFEVLSIGTCLLTNRDVEGWQDLGFVEGEDFIGYCGKEEMITQARGALAGSCDTARVAAAGFAKVRAAHTYKHRCAEVIREIEKL